MYKFINLEFKICQLRDRNLSINLSIKSYKFASLELNQTKRNIGVLYLNEVNE